MNQNKPIQEVEPQGWVMLRYTCKKEGVYFKIFASWRADDRWRLSSGSYNQLDIVDLGEYWGWRQQSDTYYKFPKTEEGGCTFYTSGVLDRLLEMSGIDDVLIERIKINSILAHFLN